MLIIRRRRGESIVIGDNVEIEILETSPTQVKLGIRAPKDVTVLRSEIRVTRDVNRVSTLPSPDRARLAQLVETLRDNSNGSSAEPAPKLISDPNPKLS